MSFYTAILNSPIMSGLAGGLAVAILLLAVVLTRSRSQKQRIQSLTEMAQQEIQRLHNEIEEVKSRGEVMLADKVRAETRQIETDQHLAAMGVEKNQLQQALEVERQARTEAEKQSALHQNNLEAMHQRMADWETARVETLASAKAATLETATAVSSKLIDDHKRETEAAKKENEKTIRETTEKLVTRFETVGQTIASLDQGVGENRKTMETVWRALSSPGGAGQYAEIGLENTLKSFGLVKGRDFVLQSQIEGKKLRPDAMVFLPGDTVLVIDSKASKFLLELADATEGEAEEEALKNLSRSMNIHLKQLSDKNYKSALRESYSEAGRSGQIKRIISVMYLPNEGAVEKLSSADPEFIPKASRMELIVAGPATLSGLIGFSKVEIDLEKRSANQEEIIETIRLMLDSFGVVLEGTVQVGKGLKSTSNNYEKLAKSINGRLLGRIKKVMDLGVRPERHKRIPASIPSFQIIEQDTSALIDGEAEEVFPLTSITDSDES